MKHYKRLLENARKNGEVVRNIHPITTTSIKVSATRSVASKPVITKIKKVAPADPDKIKQKFEEEKRKKLADAYKFLDPCADIESVGNGL